VFTLSGIIVGLSGLLWVARYASAQNETASGFELQTIAACVIGGVSIMGGTGTILGVVLGALFLGIVNNALTVINLSPFYQMGIQGFVILVAIVANTLVDRRNRLAMLQQRKL
jgi:rhamnose transport system permease protein